MEELNKYQEQVRSYNQNLEEIKNSLEEAEEELDNFEMPDKLSPEEELADILDLDADKLKYFSSLSLDERGYIDNYIKKTGAKNVTLDEVKRVILLYNSSEFVIPEKTIAQKFNSTRDLTEKERILIDAGLINSSKHIHEGRALPVKGEITTREAGDNVFASLKIYKPENKSRNFYTPPKIIPIPEKEFEKIPSHWNSKKIDASSLRKIDNNNRNRA